MVREVALTDIVDNPFQPRTSFDRAAIQSLADEIQAEGFWNTTLQGRRTKNGKVELVFGHRRLRALRLLKMDAIKLELVDLSDGQMALRSLEENLQREGLTELERADAVKRAVEIASAEREASGKPERGAVQEVADRLGLTHQWVSNLCQVSASILAKHRPLVEDGLLAAQTVHDAREWGGDAYVQTLAKQGKQSTKDDAVSKPTSKTVRAMRKAVNQAPEPVREKLKEAIVSGEITTAKEAEQKARRLASTHVRRQKEPPPDLKVIIVGWTHTLTDWEKQMRDVAPYMDYVEEVPTIAKNFRVALERLIETAKKLL